MGTIVTNAYHRRRPRQTFRRITQVQTLPEHHLRTQVQIPQLSHQLYQHLLRQIVLVPCHHTFLLFAQVLYPALYLHMYLLFSPQHFPALPHLVRPAPFPLRPLRLDPVPLDTLGLVNLLHVCSAPLDTIALVALLQKYYALSARMPPLVSPPVQHAALGIMQVQVVSLPALRALQATTALPPHKRSVQSGPTALQARRRSLLVLVAPTQRHHSKVRAPCARSRTGAQGDRRETHVLIPS